MTTVDRLLRISTVIATAMLVASLNVYAFDPQPEPPLKAQAAKIKAAGRLAACETTALWKAVIKGFDPQPEPPKCLESATKAFTKAEATCVKSGVTCTQGDADLITRVIADTGSRLGGALTGAITPRARFVDNGDGTVTDFLSGLTWEKKTGVAQIGGNLCDTFSSCPDPHDRNNNYNWSNNTTVPTGTVFTNFLGRLNGAYDASCFAQHCDWRLPTKAEYETLFVGREPCTSSPCEDPDLGPVSAFQWSATTDPGDASKVWGYDLYAVGAYTGTKTFVSFARAVRGGL